MNVIALIAKSLFLLVAAALLGAVAGCSTRPNPRSCFNQPCADGLKCNLETELCESIAAPAPDGGTDASRD